MEHPGLVDDPPAVFELLWGEFLAREDAGETPSLEEYAHRFPSHAPQLEKQIRLHHALRRDRDSNTLPGQVRPLNVQAAPARPATPNVVAGYEILSELGRGGMGVVFRARHHHLQRVVALKMILSARFACAEEVLRFRLEGETAASLQHPNIVQVYEVGTWEGQPYMVLEYVEGGTLAQRLKGQRLPVSQAAQLVETLARAVHVAHLRGVVHRDLKPSNVLLSMGPMGPMGPMEMPAIPKITDFGLAKQLDRVGGLTETGCVLGTPEYMAPEQAAGRNARRRPAHRRLRPGRHPLRTAGRPRLRSSRPATRTRSSRSWRTSPRRCGSCRRRPRATWKPSAPAAWKRRPRNATPAPRNWRTTCTATSRASRSTPGPSAPSNG